MQSVIENLIKQTGKKISYEEIGKAIGTTKQNVGYLYKNNSELPEDKIQEIQKYFKVDFTKVKEQEKEASSERPDWLKDLTGKEELFLQELIEKDKELFSLFYGACSGDQKKIKLFCQYLASRYGVDVDL